MGTEAPFLIAYLNIVLQFRHRFEPGNHDDVPTTYVVLFVAYFRRKPSQANFLVEFHALNERSMYMKGKVLIPHGGRG